MQKCNICFRLESSYEQIEFTNLGWCEIAQAGVGAIDGSLLNDAVACLAIAQVIGP